MKRLIVPFLLMCFVPKPSVAQVVYFSAPPNVQVNGATISGAGVMGNFNRIISDGNTAYAAFLAAIAALSGAPTPAGAVVPFKLAACPTGWIPSDGTAGTVDLRGRFIRGTTGSPAVGTVQADSFIAHSHIVPGTFVNNMTFGSSFFPTGAVFFAASANNMNTGNPTSGNAGSETRPKNVALLYCQKT